jgi:hypothetical protein
MSEIDGIKINPELPEDFDITPNDERSPEEIDEWWGVPFVENRGDGYAVRCLDGGAWDRATLKGIYNTLDEAVQVAKEIKELNK